MSKSVTPNWTDNLPLIVPTALIKGSATALQVSRATLDLRTKKGAMLFLAIGTGGSTAIVNPCNAIVRRILNSDATGTHQYATPLVQYSGRTTSGVRQINNGSNYVLGTTSFIFDGSGGTAHAIDDKLFFWGVTTIPTASGAINPTFGCEVVRCAGGLTTPLIIDAGTKYAHNDNEFIGNADSWSCWLPGGSMYEVIFDYTGATAGEACAVMADYQLYLGDTIAVVAS